MAKLKVPSLQHLARTWRDSPELVHRSLVNTALHPPRFSYELLHIAIRDMMLLGVSYERVVEFVRLKEKRTAYAKTLLETLPLIREHLGEITPDFFQGVAPRHYPIAQDIMIPFQPPCIYGVNGRIYFPWFSFWRSNPLAGKRLSLFVTLVDEILLQDPDLENAAFQILDFSIPKAEHARQLVVMNAGDIPRLTKAERNEMLAIFAEGYRSAKSELAGTQPKKSGRQESARHSDAGQHDLFDGAFGGGR